MAAWLDLLLVDLGLLRVFFNRPVEVVPGIWRSNQPTKWRLRSLARRGFRSVLNLRGEGHSGAFHLEHYNCQRLGLELRSIKMSSRRPPTREQLLELMDIVESAPKPLLLHCKSGADRAGLMSAVAVLLGGHSVARAKAQLSLRFLHIKHGPTGMMDAVIEAYEDSLQSETMSFKQWVVNRYDRDAIANSFKPSPLGQWLVDKVMQRE